MAALVILSTSLLAVMLIRNQSLQKAADTHGLMKAVQLAEQKLNEFQVHGYPESETQGFFPDQPGFSWVTTTRQITLPGKASVYRLDLVIGYPTLGKSSGNYLVTTAFSKDSK